MNSDYNCACHTVSLWSVLDFIIATVSFILVSFLFLLCREAQQICSVSTLENVMHLVFQCVITAKIS